MILIGGTAPRRASSLRRAAVCTLVLCIVWLVAANFVAPLEPSFSETATTRVARFGVEELRRKEKSLGDYVLVIEGSSATSRAVDGELLESELRAAGVSASVIQVSLDGANHLERLQILREFVQGLDAVDIKQLQQSRVILCREVEYNYDRDPFNNIDQNTFTDRTLAYVNPQNLPEIARWFVLRSHWIGLIRKRELVGSILGMEFFDLFRVGYLERLDQDGSLPPLNGFLPKETRKPDFNPSGPLPLSFPSNPSTPELKNYHSLRAWVADRDTAYVRLFKQFGATQCFFNVTSWSSPLYRYNHWLSESAKNRLSFSGDAESLRRSLADPDLWADDVHLRPEGARIFTTAFANYFIDAIKNQQL